MDYSITFYFFWVAKSTFISAPGTSLFWRTLVSAGTLFSVYQTVQMAWLWVLRIHLDLTISWRICNAFNLAHLKLKASAFSSSSRKFGESFWVYIIIKQRSILNSFLRVNCYWPRIRRYLLLVKSLLTYPRHPSHQRDIRGDDKQF